MTAKRELDETAVSDLEDTMDDTERRQRSEFQFSMFKLNLTAAAALAAFAFNSHKETFLLIPIVSFTLGCFWIHQGIAIRLGHESYVPPPWTLRHSLSVGTFVLALITNFVLLPLSASLFLCAGCKYPALRYLDYALMTIAAALFVTWLFIQYGTSAPRTESE